MVEKQFGIKIEPIWHEKEGNTPRYFTGVRMELERILNSRGGKALAKALAADTATKKRPVLLMPYEGQDCNAQEDGVSPGSPQPVVLFTPNSARATPCVSDKTDGKFATLPHEILFHELVHALRHGTKRRKMSNSMTEYGNTEEFIAIVVTNIFISDKTNTYKTGLRADWLGHNKLDPQLADSFRFYTSGGRTFGLIAGFCDQNRDFAKELAELPAHFNPVWAYYKDPERAWHLAATSQADADIVFDEIEVELLGRRKYGDEKWKQLKAEDAANQRKSQ